MENNLDELISKVITTFKFHGVEIKKMKLNKEVPEFDITISKSKKIRDTKEELDFVYWTLWSLIYGKYTEGRSEEIILNYKEVR